jgi:hypothetical protein
MKLVAWGTAVVLGTAMMLPAVAQENQAERQADIIARQNAAHEPHMAAALEHLRQAQMELEKASANKGGHRAKALELVQQARSEVEQGIQYFNTHPDKKK